MSAEQITHGLHMLARKAACQAAHVRWFQDKTGCTDEEAETMLKQRLDSDLILFNGAVVREIVAPEIERLFRRDS